jgi:hypothetical protein
MDASPRRPTAGARNGAPAAITRPTGMRVTTADPRVGTQALDHLRDRVRIRSARSTVRGRRPDRHGNREIVLGDVHRRRTAPLQALLCGTASGGGSWRAVARGSQHGNQNSNSLARRARVVNRRFGSVGVVAANSAATRTTTSAARSLPLPPAAGAIRPMYCRVVTPAVPLLVQT